MSKSKAKVRIQGITIEYDGDDPETFRKAFDAAMDAAFAPIVAATMPIDSPHASAGDRTTDPEF